MIRTTFFSLFLQYLLLSQPTLLGQEIDRPPLENRQVHEVSKIEAQIEKALLGEAKYCFDQAPLIEKLDSVSERHKIPTVLHLSALRDAGLDAKTPLTLKSKNTSLRTALRTMLQKSQIIFLIKDDELIFTTQEYVENHPEEYTILRQYNVTELVQGNPGTFCQRIQKSIDATSWLEPQGGPGELTITRNGNKSVLWVQHTSEHHFQIAEFLKGLRNINRDKRAADCF